MRVGLVTPRNAALAYDHAFEDDAFFANRWTGDAHARRRHLHVAFHIMDHVNATSPELAGLYSRMILALLDVIVHLLSNRLDDTIILCSERLFLRGDHTRFRWRGETRRRIIILDGIG